jgi:hypothetical protein
VTGAYFAIGLSFYSILGIWARVGASPAIHRNKEKREPDRKRPIEHKDMHPGDATLKEPSAPHIEVSSGRYRALTEVMTVAGAAPDLIESHRTSLLTYPDQ